MIFIKDNEAINIPWHSLVYVIVERVLSQLHTIQVTICTTGREFTFVIAHSSEKEKQRTVDTLHGAWNDGVVFIDPLKKDCSYG